MKKQKRYVLIILNILVIILTFLLIIEFYVRINYDNLIRFFPEREKTILYRMNINNFENLVFFPGFKNNDISRKEGTYRIICLGDSVSEGGGLESYDMIYSVKLEKLLNEKFKNKVEILNFATGDSSIDDHYQTLKRFAIPNNPDLIILQINENDYRIKQKIRDYSPKIDKIRQNIEKIFFIKIAKWINYWLQVHEYLRYDRSLKNYDKVANVKESLSLIIETCKKEDIPLITFLVWSPPIMSEKLNFSPIEIHLKNENIPFFDLYRDTEFKKLTKKQAYAIVGDTGKIIDGHPSEIGHKMMAEKLMNIIIKNRYLNKTK
jgi:lysophospholipase L1-like esterase